MGRRTNSDGDSSMRDSNTPVGNVQRWKMNREIFRGNNVDCWLAVNMFQMISLIPLDS